MDEWMAGGRERGAAAGYKDCKDELGKVELEATEKCRTQRSGQ